MVSTKLAAVAGVGVHFIFNRREPTVLQFFAVVLSLWAIPISPYIKSAFIDGTPVSTSLLAEVKDACLFTLTFLATLSASTIAYRLSPWHPLATYPGPILARITKWWMSYWIGKGNRHLKLQELHEQYGPWVRIGPNELSVNTPTAIRQVYGQMFRSPFYQGAPQDADALITTIDRAEHANRLIGWNKAFSTESLRNFRSLAQIRTDQLTECLQSQKDASINLSHWISLWAMDIMGDMSFSGGFETMKAGKDEEGWMEVLHIGVLFVGILGQVPWMRDIIALLPQPGPIMTFQKFAGRKVQETKAANNNTVQQDILGIIQHNTTPELTAKQASADASFMVLAANDTVSEGSTALFRYIIANPKIQSKLREELKGAADTGGEIDYATLSKLPYLDACVQEVLRIMPPVAAGPPRWNKDVGTQILDKYIPPSTTVACPTYAIHRNPANFILPEDFLPERWLPDSTLKPHNIEAFVPFSYGSGVCIGKPVALYNMKLLVARLLLKFEFSFSDGFDVNKFDRSWKEHNLWVHDPLLVKVKPLE